MILVTISILTQMATQMDTAMVMDTALDLEDTQDMVHTDTMDTQDTVDSTHIILMMTLALTTCSMDVEDTEIFMPRLRKVMATLPLTPQMTTTNTQSQNT